MIKSNGFLEQLKGLFESHGYTVRSTGRSGESPYSRETFLVGGEECIREFTDSRASCFGGRPVVMERIMAVPLQDPTTMQEHGMADFLLVRFAEPDEEGSLLPIPYGSAVKTAVFTLETGGRDGKIPFGDARSIEREKNLFNSFLKEGLDRFFKKKTHRNGCVFF